MRTQISPNIGCGVLVAALLGMALPGRAAVIANLRGPYVTEFGPPRIVACNGEIVELEREIHALLRVTEERGRVAHVGGHVDFHTEGVDSQGNEHLYFGAIHLQTRGSVDEAIDPVPQVLKMSVAVNGCRHFVVL